MARFTGSRALSGMAAMASGNGCELSVVVPVFNEAEVLPLLQARLLPVLASACGSFEIVYVDDGSSDGSAEVLEALRAADPRVAVVRFSRNFGKEIALTAGLSYARGQAVVTMDSDLQHPPESIPDMLAAWREGVDIVSMRRRSRSDEPAWKRAAAQGFYSLLDRMSDTPIPADIGDFRLLSRRAVDAINQLPERNRFMKGLFGWIGFPQRTLEFECAPRAAGHTKWSGRQLLGFAFEGIVAHSAVPLRTASWLGLLSACLAFCLGVYYFAKALMFGDPIRGFPTLVVSMFFLGGLQLMSIGLLGAYIGRLSVESKQRPLFIVQDYWPAHADADAAVGKKPTRVTAAGRPARAGTPS